MTHDARRGLPTMQEMQTHAEEIANSLTHGLGLVLSAAGLAVLVTLAALKGTALHITAVSVYGASMVFLYAASTLYHVARRPRIKHLLRVLDHIAILVMIAGSYTPFALVLMHPTLGWTLFGLVWSIAVIGMLFKIFSGHRFAGASTVLYVAMGWLAVLFIKPMLEVLPLAGFLWLVAGGLAYTVGVAFFAWERLPFNHTIWHLFVLAGSFCHFMAVLFYVIPSA